MRTNVGGTATFAVAVTNAPNARFQWRKGAINLVDDLRIGGSTSALLTITDVQAGDAANYSVVIVADTGTTISAPTALWLAAHVPAIVSGQTLRLAGKFPKCFLAVGILQLAD